MRKTIIWAVAFAATTIMTLPVTAQAATGNSATALPIITPANAVAYASPSATSMTFSMRLSAASKKTVSVSYATKNGTALAGTDYVAASGTLTFPAGATREKISVRLVPVRFGAGGATKAFSLTLSAPKNATLSKTSATGEILPATLVVSSADTFGDTVINPSSSVAYLTVPAKNQVDVLNLLTGKFEKPIFVGSDPTGLDITPDGKTLLVCDTGGLVISKVDLTTGAVTSIVTPGGFQNATPYSIAVVSGGYALFTTTFSGTGFGGDTYLLNLKTNAISLMSSMSPVTEVTPLARSRDYSTVASIVGDDSGGPYYLYSAKTQKVISGNLQNFIAAGALNGDGSVLLVDGTYVINGRRATWSGQSPAQRAAESSMPRAPSGTA